MSVVIHVSCTCCGQVYVRGWVKAMPQSQLPENVPATCCMVFFVTCLGRRPYSIPKLSFKVESTYYHKVYLYSPVHLLEVFIIEHFSLIVK